MNFFMGNQSGCVAIHPAMNFPPPVRLQIHTNNLLNDIKTKMVALEKAYLPPEIKFDFEEELKQKIKNYHLALDRMLESSDEIIKPQLFVRRRLPSIDFLRKMLLEISVVFKRASGNQRLFMEWVKNVNPIYPKLINILLGVNFPIEKLVTFSFWDRFIAQCIIGWCVLNEKQITPMTLYNIIDSINGDTPYRPPPPPKKNSIPPIKRSERSENLLKNDVVC